MGLPAPLTVGSFLSVEFKKNASIDRPARNVEMTYTPTVKKRFWLLCSLRTLFEIRHTWCSVPICFFEGNGARLNWRIAGGDYSQTPANPKPLLSVTSDLEL